LLSGAPLLFEVVSLSRTGVLPSFYILSSLIVKKFRALPIVATVRFELDQVDHSSSEKKSFRICSKITSPFDDMLILNPTIGMSTNETVTRNNGSSVYL
jgi:hypothetical protein